MDSKTYIANAIKTESVPASLDINQIDLHQLLTITILAAEVANQLKRKLFYGNPLTRETLDPILDELMGNANNIRATMEDCPEAINRPIPQDQFDAMVAEAGDEIDAGKAGVRLDNLNIRLLHSALGMFSESGEVLEALMKQFEGGKAVLDGVNVLEELGDISWYQAIAVDELCGDLDAVRDTNIAKLAKRYPDKFSAEAALNRDVAAERVILETVSAAVPTPSERSLQLAARAWCAPSTSHIVMNPALAIAFAEILDAPVLQESEQYRLQMAGISTAALGYWKEGDSIHPDYDTIALRDVAKLYVKYDTLFQERLAAGRESVTVVENDVGDRADMAECLAIRRNGVLIQTMAGTPVAS